MSAPNSKHDWKTYCAEELSVLVPLLAAHGYTLADNQPHVKGERFLMQAITTTGGRKLILLGKAHNGQRVVIKATRDTTGKQEIQHDRACKNILHDIDFAGDIFHTPADVAFIEEKNFTVYIQEYIDQSSSFLERPLAEQCAFALQAFKGQESAHATTYKHKKKIQEHYTIRDASAYLTHFTSFKERIIAAHLNEPNLLELLTRAEIELTENLQTIEQYCGFLTHTDFVPHNFRIAGNTIYLLDYSSLVFGNKYEGWARFLNFMTLHNPPLQVALEKYVRDNRAPEESVSLRLMRIYRLGEIIFYYTNTLPKSSGDLLTLNRARVTFWKNILSYVLQNQPVPPEVIVSYATNRDALRSDDEKERQKGLL